MGTVLAVFLKILQIIGIILLSIVCLVLFVAAIILFVPVRYKAEGEYNDGEYKVRASGSWLMHILSFSYLISNRDKGKLIIKIFGINPENKKKKKRKKKRKIRNKSNKVKIKEAKVASLQEAPKVEENFEPDNAEEYIIDDSEDIIILEEELPKESLDNEELPSEDPDDEESPKEASENEKVTDSVQETTKDNKEDSKENIQDTQEDDQEDNLEDKEKDSKDSSKYGKIREYIEIIKSDEFKASFNLCKKQIKRLLKAILPKKWNVNLDLAFTDPEKYGKVMGYYGMLFALLYKHVDFSCLPDDNHIRVKAKAKGRIFIISILLVGLKVYFNKNIRKLLKMFKVEE